jgi:hypothetical protein
MKLLDQMSNYKLFYKDVRRFITLWINRNGRQSFVCSRMNEWTLFPAAKLVQRRLLYLYVIHVIRAMLTTLTNKLLDVSFGCNANFGHGETFAGGCDV